MVVLKAKIVRQRLTLDGNDIIMDNKINFTRARLESWY